MWYTIFLGLLCWTFGCQATKDVSDARSWPWGGPKVENFRQMPGKVRCLVVSPETDPSFSDEIRDPDFWMFRKVSDGYLATRLDSKEKPWGDPVALTKSSGNLIELTFHNSLIRIETVDQQFELALVSPESKWFQKMPVRKGKSLRNCRATD